MIFYILYFIFQTKPGQCNHGFTVGVTTFTRSAQDGSLSTSSHERGKGLMKSLPEEILVTNGCEGTGNHFLWWCSPWMLILPENGVYTESRNLVI